MNNGMCRYCLEAMINIYRNCIMLKQTLLEHIQEMEFITFHKSLVGKEETANVIDGTEKTGKKFLPFKFRSTKKNKKLHGCKTTYFISTLG